MVSTLPRTHRHSGSQGLGTWKGLFVSLIFITVVFTLYRIVLGLRQWRGDAPAVPGSPGGAKYWSAEWMKSLRQGTEVRLLADHTKENGGLPTILILTPVKNAVKNMPHYIQLVKKLTYPHHRISFGFLDSDSTDTPPELLARQAEGVLEAGGADPLPAEGTGDKLNASNVDPHTLHHTATLYRLIHDIPALEDFRSVTIIQHNFGFILASKKRHGKAVQLARRAILAQSRNHLLISALRDESYVLWLDVDVFSYPADVIQTLLSSKKQIVVPRCVMSHNGRAYDLNSWRANTSLTANATLEQVIQYHDGIHARMVAARKPNVLMVEGYGKTGNQYMHEMLGEGDVVRLDAVGGAMLLVDAELHRKGLIFPPFVYRHRIETEGLSMMALDMGVMSYGMPNVEIIHKLR